jgi:prophage antirepressor-like protein
MSAELTIERIPFDGPLDHLTVVTDQHSIPAVDFYLSTEVGAALEYTGDDFNRAMNTWTERGELREQVHRVTWTGEQLRSLKQAKLVGSRATSLNMLTRRGLDRVLILTGRPIGLKVRDWLDGTLLPAVREGAVPSLSEAAIRRLVDERIRHHIVDLERTIVGVLATVETRRLEVPPPRKPEPRQREIDPEAMLDSWDRLFGSSRVSASDAYAISHRVSPTEPLRSLANECKNVVAFGHRLSALVWKEGRRLERGTTGARRFYRLVQTSDLPS